MRVPVNAVAASLVEQVPGTPLGPIERKYDVQWHHLVRAAIQFAQVQR